MSEIKGCMNCGNISCKNNKKRESVGCVRWKDPEETEKEYKQYEAVISAAQKNFKELEEDYNSKDELFKKIAELEKENAELKSENQKWKDEWQKQVQKATDEGYARTLQTMQLTKAKEIIKTLADDLSMYSGNYQKELLEAKQFLSEVEK